MGYVGFGDEAGCSRGFFSSHHGAGIGCLRMKRCVQRQESFRRQTGCQHYHVDVFMGLPAHRPPIGGMKPEVFNDLAHRNAGHQPVQLATRSVADLGPLIALQNRAHYRNGAQSDRQTQFPKCKTTVCRDFQAVARQKHLQPGT